MSEDKSVEPRVQMHGKLLYHSHHLEPVEIPLPVIPRWSFSEQRKCVFLRSATLAWTKPAQHLSAPSKLSQKFSQRSRGPKPFRRKCPCLQRETPSKWPNFVVSPMWLSTACRLCQWVLERLLHLREVARSIQHGEAGVVELFLGFHQQVIEHIEYARAVAGRRRTTRRAPPTSVGRHSRNAAPNTAVRASITVCRRQGSWLFFEDDRDSTLACVVDLQTSLLPWTSSTQGRSRRIHPR